MAYAKTDLFDPKLNSTAVLFKALAHPARLAILHYLAETKVCMTGDISDELPLSRTTVNQHLKELKNAGLIQGTVDGVKVNYCLNPQKIKEVKKIITTFFREIDVDFLKC
ncbi:MAG: metalloregulator ArsR/SmtB family transcription factor [Bacteroidales bacterium]|jgi:DNA-binding transcriptional ArsR family regulator|nr:metalloregulator ArsR/SmtB family transcription factor [Bacteroidales bacterium]